MMKMPKTIEITECIEENCSRTNMGGAHKCYDKTKESSDDDRVERLNTEQILVTNHFPQSSLGIQSRNRMSQEIKIFDAFSYKSKVFSRSRL